MTLRGLVVTGTDTGVGKTTVSCALLRALRAEGVVVAPWKPVETGVDGGDGIDAIRLALAAGVTDVAAVCARRLRLPASPRRAARAEGVTLELGSLVAHAQARAADGRPLLVEGAGGLLVPFTERETFADLVAALGLPALVVARDALGTVNHTLLTVEALRRREIACVGVVLNAVGGVDARDLDNAAELRESLGDVAVFGPLPWGSAAEFDAAVRATGLLRAARSALGA